MYLSRVFPWTAAYLARAHTEEREFKVQLRNPDVHQDILEFCITDLNSVSPPAGYDTLSLYPVCELLYPTEAAKQKFQPSAVTCTGPGFTTNGAEPYSGCADHS